MLLICIYAYKLNALHSLLYHSVYGIISASANTNYNNFSGYF